MMNLPTLIVLLIVIALFVGIIFKMIRDKKNGASSCSCGCSGCPNSSYCHSKAPSNE